MPPSHLPSRTVLLSTYAYDLGVPLVEFLVRLRLCSAEAALAHIAAGAFRLDGRVLADPQRLIRTADLRHGSVAELGEQRVTLGFWADEATDSPQPAPARALLYVHALERWDTHNEYEGLCRATWNGHEYRFHVVLVGDEWQRVRVGATWEAEVEFECTGQVEVLPDSPTRVAELQPVSGLYHVVCGRILRPLEERVLLAAPRWLVVDLDGCPCQGGPVEPGSWLRARGTLEARMPD